MDIRQETQVIQAPKFSDIFDLAEIQALQDAFSAATGVASIITEPDGTPITKPSSFCSLCQNIIRKTQIGLSNCKLSDAVIGSPFAQGPRIQPCMSGGLVDGGASIIVDDRHVANWLIGQVLMENASEDSLLAYADQIGVDREIYRQELRKVTRMTSKRFEEICDFLYLNAQMLSKYAYRSQQLALEIQRRSDAQSALHKLNDQLEQRIAERTLSLEETNCELEEMNAILEEEVSERKKSEQVIRELNAQLENRVTQRTLELAESEALYSATFHQSPTAIELYDADGIMIDANEACLALTGVRHFSELEGHDLFNNPNITLSIKERILRQESVRFESDFDFSLASYRSRHKGHRILDWRITPLTQEGRTSGYIAQISDVTDQRTAHSEIVKAKEAAEAASHSKTQFLANMSHEIRTPMNGIIGYTDLTLMTDLDDEQRDYLTTVKSSTQSLLRVVDDILDYSKIEAGKVALRPHPFNLSKTVDEVADLFAISFRQKDLALKINMDDRIPTGLIGDSVRLKQVLSNLLGNALKFTSRGEIVIDVRMVTISESGVLTEIRVKDTGIGIAPDEIGNLFQSFYQVDHSHARAHGGTGLGLVISKNLVEMMDGKLEVDSVLGVGSTFRFTAVFPTVQDSLAHQPTPSQLPLAVSSIKAKRILVVEDNEISQYMAKILLQKKGYHVDLVSDGREAIARVLDEPYDLVFMDLRMPHVDGITATQVIRLKQDRHIPIIALTAQAVHGDRERCLEAGMDDYLSKPLDTLELQRVLDLYA